MSDCEKLLTCIFFNDKMKNAPATAQIYKKSYCQGNNANCARYLVLKTLGADKIPVDLFPNEAQRAKKIINDS